MKRLSSILAVAAIAGTAALPMQSAQAWGGGGPWGGNMFGMDMGQSTGYPGYYGAGPGGPGYGGGYTPWGSNMFGTNMGQTTGRPYYGAPWGGYPAPAAPPR
jgi:hypothetical protein